MEQNSLNFVSDNGNALIVKNNFELFHLFAQTVCCEEVLWVMGADFLSWLDGKQNQRISHPVSFWLAFSVVPGSKKNTLVQFTHKGKGRMYLYYNIKLFNEKYQYV